MAADVAGLGWLSLFLMNVPIGLAVFALAVRFVPNTTSAHPLRLDVRGVVLLSAALLALVYPVVEGRSLGWPLWLAGLAAAGVALAAVFVVTQVQRQRQDGSAMLPMHLFANRGFSAGLVTQAAFQGAMNAFTVVFLIYVQALLGFSALAAGLSLLPFSVGAFLGTGVAVPLATKVGRPIVTLGALI